MPVYLLIEIEVTDPERYSEYVASVFEVVSKHGGRYLVRGGQVTPVAGGWNPERVIVIEFESIERLRGCFSSPEYLDLSPLRDQSTESRAIILDGTVDPSSDCVSPDIPE